MNPNAPQAAIDRVVAEIERMGAQAHLSRGKFRTVIGAVGEEGKLDQSHLASLDGVEKVVPIMKPYKLASREFHEEDSVVEVGGGKSRRPKVKVGGTHAGVIAGPCAIESEEMLDKIAATSATAARPSSAAACSSRGPALLLPGPGRGRPEVDARCGDELGMPICIEVMDPRQVELIERVRRLLPDRRPEHAELRPAQRGRQDPQGRPAEARAGRDREGLAARRPSTSSARATAT